MAGAWILLAEAALGQLPRPRNLANHDFSVEDERAFGHSFTSTEPTHASVMDDSIGHSFTSTEPTHASVMDGSILHDEAAWGSGKFVGDFGMGCPPRWYAVAEAFALRRQGDSNFSLSNGDRFDSHDYDLAGRVTIGRTYDCLDGWEASYAGPFRWSQRLGSVSDGNLQTFLLPGIGLTEGDFAAFNNADVHLQRRTSSLHSGEINRRWWGWDVFSLKIGARYLRIEEDIELLSFSGNDFGAFSSEYQNNLGLAQLGIDMMSPLGPWTFGAKLNGGIGVNFNSGDAVLVNNNRTVLNNGSSSEHFAFLLEAGIFSIYRLTERISLHAGYEAWYVWGLALPTDQQLSPMHFDSGLSYYERGDLFYHGGTLGVEIVW
jgi:hypothetical protein